MNKERTTWQKREEREKKMTYVEMRSDAGTLFSNVSENSHLIRLHKHIQLQKQRIQPLSLQTEDKEKRENEKEKE